MGPVALEILQSAQQPLIVAQNFGATFCWVPVSPACTGRSTLTQLLVNSESLPSMPSRTTRFAAAKAFATPGLTSPDRPDATAATPGPGPTNPGPAPTNPDASSPLAAAKAKPRPTPKPKIQAGLYVSQNDNVGQFKRQNVTPEQRHELDRRNRKEQIRRERRAAERRAAERH